MRRPLLILLTSTGCLLSILGNAQGVRPKSFDTPPVPALANKYTNEVNTTDFNGRPFRTYDPDAEGSPFFSDNLLYANLTLSKGTIYERVKVRLDLLNQELQLTATGGKLIVAENGLVHKIELVDSMTGVVQSRFISGCPSIDKQTSSHYYQVLSDGHLQLLFYTKRELVQEKNEMSGEIRKLYKEYTEYYTLRDGKINKLKREKDAVLSLMEDRKEEINTWLKSRKMNFRNNSMLAGLFDYYNSLTRSF
jgi:hypothetical protein